MSVLDSLLECLGLMSGDSSSGAIIYNDTTEAERLINLMYQSEKLSKYLREQLWNSVHTQGWTESLARAIYVALEAAISSGRPMSPGFQEAFDSAVAAAEGITGFARNHPVLCALVVLGVLVMLAPWVIEILGFTAEGPLADSFAAAWQSRYAGLVPEGSLFSLFQRLGMKGWA